MCSVSFLPLLLLLLLLPGLSGGSPPVANVVLYLSNWYGAGYLGNRAFTNSLCQGSSVYTTSACSSAFSLLGYTTDVVSNYTLPRNPTNGAYFSGSAPVISGSTGQVIASNWSMLWHANTYPLKLDMRDAFPFDEFGSNEFWTGINGDGTVATGNTCGNWVEDTSAFHGELGGVLFTDARWVGYTTISCAQYFYYFCVCLQPTTPSPSRAPIRTPSRSPSHTPTTSRPSRSPTTSRPSGSPTTSIPTHSPSAMPTGSPTVTNPIATTAIGSTAFVAAVVIWIFILLV